MTAGRSTFSTRAALGLGLLAAACYANIPGNGLVYDDVVQIVENPWIRSLRHLPEIFSSHPGGYNPEFLASYYRPLVNVALLITYGLTGGPAWSFHVLSILLHAAATVAAYLAVATIGRRLGSCDGAVPVLAAALFAVHPVHVEAVAWAAGIPDPLYTVFFLLSLALYAGSDLGRGGARRTAAAAAFLLAALSKETALVLPLVLVIFEAAVRGRPGAGARWAWIGRLAPFAAALALYLGARIGALGGFAPGLSERGAEAAPDLATRAALLASYALKLVWPHPLNAYYATDPVASLLAPSALAGLGVAAALVWALSSVRRHPWLAVAAALAAFPLLPVLVVRPAGSAIFAERYLYLPVLGAAIFAARLVEAAGRVRAVGPAVARTAFAAAVVALAAAGWARNAVWSDGIRLWTDAVAKSPSSAIAREFLCYELTKAGRFEEALPVCARAVEIDPSRLNARLGLGNALSAGGRYEEALAQFRAVLSVSPDNARALQGVGVAFAGLGRPDLALEPLGRAVAVRPDSAEAHNDFGVVLGRVGRSVEAAAHLREAVRLQPGNPQFAANLAKYGAGATGPAYP